MQAISKYLSACLSIWMFALLGVSNASELTVPQSRKIAKPGRRIALSPDLRLTARRPDINLIDQITMTRVPEGSLRVEYRGIHKPIVRHARRRYRKLWRESFDDRLDYMTPAQIARTYEIMGFARADVDGGRWWDREWFDSLPEDQGGAPKTPYVHYVGNDVEFKFGPLVVSNSLKFKMKTLAVLQFDTDPDRQIDPSVELPNGRRKHNFSVDIKPTSNKTFGTRFKAKLRPNISIGLPGSKLTAALRNISLRGEMEMFVGGRKVLVAQCEIAVKELRELTVTFDIALVSW